MVLQVQELAGAGQTSPGSFSGAGQGNRPCEDSFLIQVSEKGPKMEGSWEEEASKVE